MTTDTDLIVVGAGPAGVAATLMAVSLGMRVLLIEQDRVGGKLHHVGALNNVPGAWTTGPDLAAALQRDLERANDTGLVRYTTGTVGTITADIEAAHVLLDGGDRHSAYAVIAATGVTTLSPADAYWITDHAGTWYPPLWRTQPTAMTRAVWVLGADRPLGTWLRAHPDTQHQLNVLVPPDDEYKTAEIANDPRVRLVRCSKVSISPARSNKRKLLVWERPGSGTREYVASTLLNNLGNQPATIDGLVQSEDGYCPPDLQDPRVITVGDLRSAGFQRIVTAQGSGAEAALSRYYNTALVGA